MIQQRKFQVENYVIMEPGASSYMNTVETCVYRDGEVRGFEGRTLIINAGAERLDVFDQAFDTLMMINVIEHVEKWHPNPPKYLQCPQAWRPAYF